MEKDCKKSKPIIHQIFSSKNIYQESLCTLPCLFYAFTPYSLIWVTDFIKYCGRVTLCYATSQDSQAWGSQALLSNLSLLWFGHLFWGGSLFWQFPQLFHVNGFAQGWQRSRAWQASSSRFRQICKVFFFYSLLLHLIFPSSQLILHNCSPRAAR